MISRMLFCWRLAGWSRRIGLDGVRALVSLLVLCLILCLWCKAQPPKTGHPGPQVAKEAKRPGPPQLEEGDACGETVPWVQGADRSDRIYERGGWRKYGEIWDCVSDRWHRDTKAETARDAYNKLLDQTSAAITKRKLTKEEIAVIGGGRDSRGYERYYGGGWTTIAGYSCNTSFDGPDCLQRIEQTNACNTASSVTAELMAQLDFWPGARAEIPLDLLLDFVKGTPCDNAGTTRAYGILNTRITKWLRTQVGLPEEKSQ